MAVLSALGGVASTYVNTISDAVQAALGFPGATQWAAGLHVIWIVLAMGIISKPGAGTLTGILKGAVELMSGNSHGVIILLVDLVAGLLVDFGFLLFHNKQQLLPYFIGGGLGTAPNVLVFQLFATIPQNILGLSAILILFLVALVSGLIFAGFIPFFLVNALAKAGVVKISERPLQKSKFGWWFLLGVLFLAILLAIFLRINLKGPQGIQISGAVENAYEFSSQNFKIEKVTKQMDYRGTLTEYRGYPLLQIIDSADPKSNADTLLIEATDGYAFLLSFEELFQNENILLVEGGKGQNASYDVVGPVSSKAWIRNVSKLTVIASEGLKIINPEGDLLKFEPDDWLGEMDSTQIALPGGSQKLQGVPVWKIVAAYVDDEQPERIIFRSDAETIEMNWSEIDGVDNLRIFTIIEDEGIAFTLAEMSGEVRLYPLTEIVIK